ncbi:MAG: O-antigen ligase family protein [Myxococcota bacterium]|nr:O-antigen ligase family protein [Myxococcota bacterium]
MVETEHIGAQSSSARENFRPSERLALSPLIALVLATPLLFGGMSRHIQSGAAVLAALSLCLFILRGRMRALPRFIWGPIALVPLALLQLIPLPLDLLGNLSSWSMLQWRDAMELGLPITSRPLSLQPLEGGRWVVHQLAFCFVAYLAATLQNSKRWLIGAILAGGSGCALIGWIHWFTGAERPYGLYEMVDRSALPGFFTSIINNNTAAGLFLLTGSLALMVSTYAAWRKRAIFVAALMIGTLPMTESRAAIALMLSSIVFATIMIFILVMRRVGSEERPLILWVEGYTDRLGKHTVLGLTLLPLVGLYLWGLWGKLPSLTELTAEPTIRTFFDSFQLWTQAPIFGVGRGAFSELASLMQSFTSIEWVSHPESVPLQALCEGGIFGFILGPIWICVAFVLRVWYRRNELRGIPLGLAWGLGLVGLQQCFDFGLEGVSLSLPVAAALGLFFAYTRSSEVETRSKIMKERERRRARMMATILLLVSLPLIAHSIHQDPYPLQAQFKKIDQATSLTALEVEALKALDQSPGSYRVRSSYVHRALEILAPRWRASRAGGASEEEQRLLIDADERLALWLRQAKKKAPLFSYPWILSATRWQQQGQLFSAALSWREAIKRDPWRLNLLARHAPFLNEWIWAAVPLEQEYRLLRDLNRYHGRARALEILSLRPRDTKPTEALLQTHRSLCKRAAFLVRKSDLCSPLHQRGREPASPE